MTLAELIGNSGQVFAESTHVDILCYVLNDDGTLFGSGTAADYHKTVGGLTHPIRGWFKNPEYGWTAEKDFTSWYIESVKKISGDGCYEVTRITVVYDFRRDEWERRERDE